MHVFINNMNKGGKDNLAWREILTRNMSNTVVCER
jgi:hypothetical protein